MVLQQFQHQLNINRDDERREEWSFHREQIMKLLKEHFIEKKHVKRVAIIGAGNCDDLDLDTIASYCEEIYLFDIDLESMQAGISMFHETTQKKINLIHVDLSGLTEGFYPTLSSMFSSGEKVKKIKKFLVQSANELESNKKLFAYENSFDVVAISAIYTQLFYNWSLIELERFENNFQKSEINTLIYEFVYIRNRIVNHLNSVAISLCKNKGNLITWSDVAIMKKEHEEFLKKGGLKAAIQYASETGFDAGLTGIRGITNHVENLYFTSWSWHFIPERVYLTFGVSGILSK